LKNETFSIERLFRLEITQVKYFIAANHEACSTL